jgi:alpha-L-fucosidase
MDELNDSEWAKFHAKTYGKDFSYFDFAPKFTCEMYDPDQWADFFARSGAKYIVLTSKHHEGFCLWPSKEANKTWGRKWNSVDAGPGRDILGELTTAVRKRGIKMGYYFSFYEWFNPLYRSDVNAYVDTHMLPQLKDLVVRYNPDIVWPDGEWEHKDPVWRSTEFLAWLFNESAVKDTVVINDRWGKGARHNHGGYYTTEYGAGLKDATHPWEECRGMGHSFGYNRNESITDYRSGREMVLMLIDLVSRGGNLLLDIGPTGDGRIPVIMQERLVQIGAWLKVNGEAIYGTTTWKESCQWSEGKRPEQVYKEYKAKYNVMDVVGEGPKDGRAVKEMFFTSKPGALYAIVPVRPGEKLVVRDVKPARNVKVTMLGREGELSWRKGAGGMVIDTSGISQSELPCKWAWVFKIEGNIGR